MLVNYEKTSLSNRRSLRLQGYDYSSGGRYFVTICCKDGAHRFGRIVPSPTEVDEWQVEHNEFGRIAVDELENMDNRYPGIIMSGFIVMPNHVHFLMINDEPARYNLVRIVGGFKSIVSNRCMAMCKNRGVWMEPLWQKGYYEHIIRNKDDFDNTLTYITITPPVGVQRIDITL